MNPELDHLKKGLSLLNVIAARELGRRRCNHKQRYREYHSSGRYYRCKKCGRVVKVSQY